MKLAAAVALAAMIAAPAGAGPRAVVSSVTHRPERVGQCFLTRIKRVETRLEDGGRPVPGSGSAIEFADGHYNVSYDQVPAMDRGRRGDPARLCVLVLPRQCPAGDTRGILYGGRDLRTGAGWRASDAEHMCGGA